MKTIVVCLKRFIALAITFLLVSASSPSYSQQIQKEFYLAVEFNNVICGYSRILLSDSTIDGKKVQVLLQSAFANFFALGQDISQYQKFTYYIDPETGNFIYHDSYHKHGEVELGGAVLVEGDTLLITSPGKEDEIISNLPVDIILPNTQFFPYLLKDFVGHNLDTKSYHIYDVRTGKITETSYSRVGDEQLDLVGQQYNAVVLLQPDPVTGMDTKLWIDKKSGMRLKMVSANRLSIYLTDVSVQGKIKTGNWDEIFFAKTNKKISDIRNISYMKVKTSLEPFPAVGMDDVNVNGQKFTGNADETRIDGIFEISHKRYDGKNAPDFPLDTSQYENLLPYLMESEQIESNDKDIKALAVEVTDGSDDLWEAACRLSNWVADNIDGSILGGSARETYDSKSGLCGSQSQLMTALCRSVNIPARVVWGCMYTLEYGGSFGHHAWNEVFMGSAGWIPVDVTVHETNYVDSGHIRLGVLNTRQTQINSWEMEILQYKVKRSE